jgi:hypothetical protein
MLIRIWESIISLLEDSFKFALKLELKLGIVSELLKKKLLLIFKDIEIIIIV